MATERVSDMFLKAVARMLMLCTLFVWQTCGKELQEKFQKKHAMTVHPADHFNRSIVIGVPISYDIEDSFYSQGRGMIGAWELYMEWVNNKGGIVLNGQNVSITLKYMEDYSSHDYVTLAAKYFLSDEGSADFFLAPYSSGLTNTTAVQTEPNEKILIAGGSVNTNVYAGRNFTFGTLPPGYLYMMATFRSLSNFGAPRVAFLRDLNEVICVKEDVLRYNLLFSDVELYGFFEVDPTSVDYYDEVRSILEDLKANGVESVVGCSYLDLCIQIPSISRSIDYNPDGMMFIVCDTSPETIDALGDDIEHILGMIPWVPSANNEDEFVGWSSYDFYSKFVTAYSSDPTDVHASAFAGLEILVASIESTQSLNSHVLAKELSSRHFATFFANLTFDENHQAVSDLLVRQLRFNNDSELQSGLIVDPPYLAITEVVWPAPTWKERDCVRDTDSCSSHGVCDSMGECNCDPQYYGSSPETPCDSYCVGEISSSGQCRADRKYYVGGLVDYSSPFADEIKSTMRLAVELINNHSDGWYDHTRQVEIVLEFRDSKCTEEGGDESVKWLNDWAVNTSEASTTLDGLIGALCSDASKAVARFGNTIYMTQVSYWSSSVDLSNKDEFIYFARTCHDDGVQGQMLVDVIEDLGVYPFISVVHGDESFTTSLAEFIVSRYEDKGYTVLLTTVCSPSNNTDDYVRILDEMAATGSPATVLVLLPDEVDKLITAASTHHFFKDDSMIWIGIENWVNIQDVHWNRPGMFGIFSPHLPTGPGPTKSYLELWESLDPEEYIDGDNDRTSVYEPTLFVADAVFALSLAFQESINEESGLEGDLLKKHMFSVLTQQVSFEGVSGYINILSNGNRESPVFDIVNFANSTWKQSGIIDSQGTNISNYESFVWPDGTSGKLNGNAQMELYCPAGTESKQVSDNPPIFSCAVCHAGDYKAEAGTEPCSHCHEGTQCDDVGVVVPCVSPGYWRAVPEDPEDIGDFHKYEVYSCDHAKGCLGGCNLNDTCASGRDPLSVTCGVCAEGYYLNYDGDCLSCGDVNVYTPLSVTLMYLGSVLIICGLYFGLVSIFTKREVNVLYKCADMNSETVVNDGVLSNVIRKISVVSPSGLTPQNFRDAMITGKIILAFLQVMGAFCTLDIAWSSESFDSVLSSYNINVFHGNEHVVSCSKISNYVPSFYFIVLNAFFLPILLMVLFAGISSGFYHYHRLSFLRQNSNVSPDENCFREALSQLFLKLWAVFSRIMLWMFLIIYPSISSIMLSVFNCRDFGESGLYLRADYSINCNDSEYNAYFSIAIAGVLLYILGIPFAFFYAIWHRHSALWESSSRFLHHGFVDEWKYYEIFDLLRKLLLTSMSQFVGSPNSPSEVLFLLLIDSFSLYVISNAKPFLRFSDDFLCCTLTFIECCAFLFAFLVVSGVSDSEGYNESFLFYTLISMIIVGLLFVAPFSFIVKIEKFERKVAKHVKSAKKRFSRLSNSTHQASDSIPSSEIALAEIRPRDEKAVDSLNGYVATLSPLRSSEEE